MRLLCFYCLMLLFSTHAFSAPRANDAFYRIAIIDRFFPPVHSFENEEDKSHHQWLYGIVDIDQDNQKEPYYHGDIVQLIASHPTFIFMRYPIAGVKKPLEEILDNLHNLSARMHKLPVKALVLSWEASTLISAFETPLQMKHAHRYKNSIREWGESDTFWRVTYQIILALESLTAQGVQVFTIAGNSGKATINTFSFAEGVTTVGASERELDYFIANNVFVDRKEQAAYFFLRRDDSEGKPLGYDVNGDGCYDIPTSRLSGLNNSQPLPATLWPPIKGSSFAAPMAMKKALIGPTSHNQCSN